MNHVRSVSLDLAWVPKRKLDVGDFLRMGDLGILAEGDGVELVEGELIAMSPIGVGHAGMVNRLTRLFSRSVGDRALLSVQNPLRLDAFNLPQPDLLLLRPRPDDYATSHPIPADVLLCIEVGATSLRYERSVKRPLYAQYGVSEFWIVDLSERRVEICRSLSSGGYTDIVSLGAGDVAEPQALPGLRLSVADIVG